MVRHAGHWLDTLEAVAIIGVLLGIAWLTWQALSSAYTPVLHLLGGL